MDNIGYIRELENCATPIFLRPKRFGKSIVCSMHDVNRKDRFLDLFGRQMPDEETVAQAKYCRESLPRRPGWHSEIVTCVVEVCFSRGYNWFEVA